MKNNLAKIMLFSLVTAALIAVPAVSRAEDKPAVKPAADAGQPAAKKRPTPFHGKVAAVDAAAATVTVGKTTINITSETKITKDGKPATLSEIVVGDTVGGSYKKDDAGKSNATTLNAGEKAPKEKAPKVEKQPADMPK